MARIYLIGFPAQHIHLVDYALKDKLENPLSDENRSSSTFRFPTELCKVKRERLHPTRPPTPCQEYQSHEGI